MNDEEVCREVTRAVEEAISKNRRIETVLIVNLVLVALAGLSLLVIGAAYRQWTLALPGSFCEFAIALPIRSLVKLRQENIRLAILPQLIRMADDASAKKLVMKFVEKLINQI